MNTTQETLEEIAKETKRIRVLFGRFMIYFVIWTWTPLIAAFIALILFGSFLEKTKNDTLKNTLKQIENLERQEKRSQPIRN